MVTSFYHCNDVTDLRAAVLFFYVSLGLVRVWEIDLSHMGRNNGNPNLVYKNCFIPPSHLR